MSKKKKKKILTLLIILFVLMIIEVSYALLKFQLSYTKQQVLRVGNFSLALQESNDI